MLAIKRKCIDFGPPEGKRFYKIVPINLLLLVIHFSQQRL